MQTLNRYRSLREIKTVDQMLTLQSDICKVGLKKLMRSKEVVLESYTTSYRKFLLDLDSSDSPHDVLVRALNKEYDIHTELLDIVIKPIMEGLYVVVDAELRRRDKADVLNKDLSNVYEVLVATDKYLHTCYDQLIHIICSRLLSFTYANIVKYVSYTTSIYKNTF